jgi:hypothetical protein
MLLERLRCVERPSARVTRESRILFLECSFCSLDVILFVRVCPRGWATLFERTICDSLDGLGLLVCPVNLPLPVGALFLHCGVLLHKRIENFDSGAALASVERETNRHEQLVLVLVREDEPLSLSTPFQCERFKHGKGIISRPLVKLTPPSDLPTDATRRTIHLQTLWTTLLARAATT